jgi:hypothetical protein
MLAGQHQTLVFLEDEGAERRYRAHRPTRLGVLRQQSNRRYERLACKLAWPRSAGLTQAPVAVHLLAFRRRVVDRARALADTPADRQPSTLHDLSRREAPIETDQATRTGQGGVTESDLGKAETVGPALSPTDRRSHLPPQVSARQSLQVESFQRPEAHLRDPSAGLSTKYRGPGPAHAPVSSVASISGRLACTT